MPTWFYRRNATTDKCGTMGIAGNIKTVLLHFISEDKVTRIPTLPNAIGRGRLGRTGEGESPITLINLKPTYSSLITSNFSLSVSPFGVVLEQREFSLQVCHQDTLEALNTNFNDGTTQGYSGTNVSLSNSSNSLAVTRTGGMSGYAYQTFSVTAGTSYTLTANVDIGTCGGSLSISIRDLYGNVIAVTTSSTGSISLNFTATTDTVYQVRFTKAGPPSTCDFYVDDVRISYIGQVCGTGNFNYRHGFNGMERDDEVKGSGNSYDFGARLYDSRLGRFLTVDPIYGEYSMLSSYQFASNTPIWAIDLDGLEAVVYTVNSDKQTGVEHNQHAFIAVKDETGKLIVYTYGRYAGSSQGKRGGAIGGAGVMIKLEGNDAISYINKEKAQGNFKATLIENADAAGIIKYYDNKMANGKDLTKAQLSILKGEIKSFQGAKLVRKYNVLTGSICSGWVERGLKYGGGVRWRWGFEDGYPEITDRYWSGNNPGSGIGIYLRYSVEGLQNMLDETVLNDIKISNKINELEKQKTELVNSGGSAFKEKIINIRIKLLERKMNHVKDVSKEESKSPGKSLN